MKKWAVLAGLLLAGCSQKPVQSEIIYLARGDAVVKCGPYVAERNLGRALERAGAGFQGNLARYDAAHASEVVTPITQLRQCVMDYQKAGYERVPAP